MYLVVSKQLLTMLLIGMVGFIFAKATKVKEAEQKFLSKVLLYLVNPCMVFSRFDIDFSWEKLNQLLIVIGISVVVHLVMIAVGWVTTITKDPVKKQYADIDRASTVFTNCGFIGIPLIRGVLGDEGVFFLMGFIVVFNIGVWTYGYWLMSGSINLKKIILNPTILAVIGGLVLFCVPYRLPAVIATPINIIGELNTAVAMIVIGCLFADFKLPEKNASSGVSRKTFLWMLGKAIFVRLVLNGFVVLGVLLVFYRLMGSMPDVKLMMFVTYISALCPSATTTTSMACLFDRDTTYASLMISLTSILCIVTIPAFVALAELVIK